MIRHCVWINFHLGSYSIFIWQSKCGEIFILIGRTLACKINSFLFQGFKSSKLGSVSTCRCLIFESVCDLSGKNWKKILRSDLFQNFQGIFSVLSEEKNYWIWTTYNFRFWQNCIFACKVKAACGECISYGKCTMYECGHVSVAKIPFNF